MPLRGAGTFDAFFSDGNDGEVTADGVAVFSWAALVGSTYTLNRDIFTTTLSVDPGVEIKSNGYRIYASKKLYLANTAKIHNNGSDASGQTGGASGGTGSLVALALTALPPATLACGTGGDGGAISSAGDAGGGASYPDRTALGGDGGAGGGHPLPSNGGAAGTLYYGANQSGGYRSFLMMTTGYISGKDFGMINCGIGGGGGGGGGSAGATGYGGGGAGGPVVIVASEIDISAGGIIEANGGDGDSSAGLPADGADGGGGGGGVVVITCGVFQGGYTVASAYSATSGLGTVQALKGLAGTGGSAPAAADGSDGKVLIFSVG